MNGTDEPVRLFATIHLKSDERPDGYTVEEIKEINEGLNPKREGDESNG